MPFTQTLDSRIKTFTVILTSYLPETAFPPRLESNLDFQHMHFGANNEPIFPKSKIADTWPQQDKSSCQEQRRGNKICCRLDRIKNGDAILRPLNGYMNYCPFQERDFLLLSTKQPVGRSEHVMLGWQSNHHMLYLFKNIHKLHVISPVTHTVRETTMHSSVCTYIRKPSLTSWGLFLFARLCALGRPDFESCPLPPAAPVRALSRSSCG